MSLRHPISINFACQNDWLWYDINIRGVAQPGERARFGSVRSAVQIRAPRLPEASRSTRGASFLFYGVNFPDDGTRRPRFIVHAIISCIMLLEPNVAFVHLLSLYQRGSLDEFRLSPARLSLTSISKRG